MRAAPLKRLVSFCVMDGMALDELVEGIKRTSATNLTESGTLSSPVLVTVSGPIVITAISELAQSPAGQIIHGRR